MTSQTTFTSCLHDVMLESNQDDVKLEAMRCVTVMTAKGKLSVPRTLFPHIVKNVNSKNPELKKLIYLYLTNFADQEPDMALLPVASLQKSIKSPNPLVRSSALKVLTSTRLNILTAIFMATLRNSVNDLSPQVRKTVAHSIIKIYRLDPSLKGDLMEYIERLFEDKNSTVLSSAVATFEVVCPERLDLIRKHFRRLCFILADCNEWGQTMMVKLLMRSALDTYNRVKAGEDIGYNPAEHNLKILLRAAKPLMHSANAAVVVAVIKLYIGLADSNEVRSVVPRPFIRLLHSRREIQLSVLKMIEELTTINLGDPIEQHDTCDLNDEQDEKRPEEDVDDDDSEDEQLQHQDEKPLGQSSNEDSQKEEDKSNDNEAEKQQSASPDNATAEEENHDEEEDADDEEEYEYEYEEVEVDEDEELDEEEEEEEEEIDVVAVERADKSEKVTNGTGEHSTANTKNAEMELVDFESNKDPKAFRELFRPHIKCFYVKYTDCTQVRLAKLRILTNLSSPVNVNQILRELQAYIAIYVEDRELITAAIQAMGRCAIIVKEVAHNCLNALTNLLSNNNEHIVSEAIVVLRSQIMNKKPQANPEEKVTGDGDGPVEKSNCDNSNSEQQQSRNQNLDATAATDEVQDEDSKIVSTVIKQVTKLLPTVTAPQARATILWIIAEFCNQNRTAAKCAPNVLRMVAKSFCTEDNFVKLQALTLTSKFLLSLDKEKKASLYQKIQLLTSYLFSLTKYDTNHDVRDRGRFLKKLLEEEEICSKVLNGVPNHSIALKS